MYRKTLILTLALLSTVSCDRSLDKRDVRPVKTEEVMMAADPVPEVYSGVTKSETVIKTSFRVSGQIESIPIKVGQVLKKGELIAKLKDDDIALEVDQALAQLEKVEAQERNATSQYRRIKSLYESDSVSRNDLDSARANYEASKAAVLQAIIHVQQAKQKHEYLFLHSEKENCVVSQVYAEDNENVKAGQTVAELSCGKMLEVAISVPESEIHYFKVGDYVSVEFNALPNKFFSGKVDEVGYTSKIGTTFPVTVIVKQEDNGVRSGMAAKVYFDKEDPKEESKILVPLDVVSEDSEGHYLYIFDPDGNEMGTAKKRYVKLGKATPSGLEVVEGLTIGEKYISAGTRYLRDGRKVRLIEE